jgi:hypothetical protein
VNDLPWVPLAIVVLRGCFALAYGSKFAGVLTGLDFVLALPGVLSHAISKKPSEVKEKQD